MGWKKMIFGEKMPDKTFYRIPSASSTSTARKMIFAR